MSELEPHVNRLHSLVGELRTKEVPFAVATIIDIEGSASARTASKAVFDQTGRNVEGWVGGGCAERYIGEQAVEAIAENKTRIVMADMTDEVFGLGVVCGGKMRIFIEPVLPRETVEFPNIISMRQASEKLSELYGWKLNFSEKVEREPTSMAELLTMMSSAIARKRGRTGLSLRELKKMPVTFAPVSLKTKEITIVGQSRITQALARHFVWLGFNVTATGPSVSRRDYPETPKCSCATESYNDTKFSKGSAVVVAAHTPTDPELVERALKAEASYVAMIGSRVRVVEVFNHLGIKDNAKVEQPLFVPTGLDIDARHPEEIALSIAAEIISLSENN